MERTLIRLAVLILAPGLLLPVAARADFDICQLLSKDQATALLGAPVADSPLAASLMCRFSAANDPKDVAFVTIIDLGETTKMLYDGKAKESGTTPVAGLGDAAFRSEDLTASPKEYYITVLAGTRMLQLTTAGIHQDDPHAALVTAAKAALANLAKHASAPAK